MRRIQTLYDKSKKRRVVIFQRDDGSFGFEHQRFSEEPLEMAWVSITGRTADATRRRARWPKHAVVLNGWHSQSGVMRTPPPNQATQRTAAEFTIEC